MRRLWIGLPAAALLLAAGDVAGWYFATARLADGFAAWERARRAEGWTVQSGPPRWAGWPLSAAIVVPGFELSFTPPRQPLPMTWRAERLVLRVRAPAPADLRLRPLGAQSFALGGAPAVPYRAESLLVTVPLDRHAGAGVATLQAHGLRAGNGADGLAIGSAQLRAHWDERAAKGQTAGAVRLDVRAVRLPAGARWPLGRRIAAFAAQGTLDGPVAPAGTPQARARAWQQAGGSLLLRHVDLRWGPLTASLEAKLGLDGDLQPSGTGRAMVIGYAQALDTLAANGALPNDAALAAKAMLSVMADAPGPDGEAGEITLPFTLDASVLNVRGVPLMRLPPLSWPGAPAEDGAAGVKAGSKDTR